MADLFQAARDRWEEVTEAESETRARFLEDARFDSGDQWPAKVRTLRENDPTGARPVITINKAATHRRAITNSIRQARPSIRVNPVDDKADPETASMLNGMLRHIQQASDADYAYDTAVDGQTTGGLGYFEIVSRATEPGSDQQEIGIKPILNPLSVRMDPNIEISTGQDQEWCFTEHSFSRAKLARRPRIGKKRAEAATSWDFDSPGDKAHQKNLVRVVRYWHRDYKTGETMLELDDGTRTPEKGFLEIPDDMRPGVVRKFKATIPIVKWAYLDGTGVLGEEEHEWPGIYIPVVRVVGEERWIDGKREVRGLIRDIADPCRMYNYWASVHTEHVALAPKNPYVGAAAAFEGYEKWWDQAHTANLTRLPYNHKTSEGYEIPPPQRQSGVSSNPGIVQAMLQAADDIKSASGQFNESMGNQSNATSGRAIRARQQEGQVATYHFPDNLGRSMRYAGLIVIDLIPKIYDTARVTRILGEDGEPDFAHLEPTMPAAYHEEQLDDGGIRKLYNPSVGKYDVVVTVGPSYQTRRQEQAEAMTDIVSRAPQLWTVIGHKLVKAMDWPDADEMAELLKAMLPPELKQIEDARDGGRNEALQQVQQLREQMGAEMQQIMQMGQQALQNAAQEVAERDAVIEDMKTKLESKEQEFQLRAAEIQAELQGKEMDNEAKVATAVIGAQAAQQPAAPEPQATQPPAPEETPALTMLLMKMDARLDSIEQAQNANAEAIQEQGQEIARMNAEAEQRRTGALEAVAAFVGSDQSDAALKRTVESVKALN